MRYAAIIYKKDVLAENLASKINEILQTYGLESWRECSDCLARSRPPENFKPDLIISLGGDGTLLYAARAWGLTGAPLFGINLGHLGFLAETEPDQFETLLPDILQGRYSLEKRVALAVTVERHGQIVAETQVINDAVINKGALSRIINLHVSVKNFGDWSFRADGMIMSTPTGSTAYNLSAGGPVVYPTMQAVIITPICPFTLTSRPLILPADFPIEVEIGSHERDIHLTADGQVSIPLLPGDRLTAKKHHTGVSLIVNPERHFLNTLRSKLNWA